MALSVGSFGSALGGFDQQLADLHEIVCEHGRSKWSARLTAGVASQTQSSNKRRLIVSSLTSFIDETTMPVYDSVMSARALAQGS